MQRLAAAASIAMPPPPSEEEGPPGPGEAERPRQQRHESNGRRDESNGREPGARAHDACPSPAAFRGDGVATFSEPAAAAGALGRFPGLQVMPLIRQFAGWPLDAGGKETASGPDGAAGVGSGGGARADAAPALGPKAAASSHAARHPLALQ